MKSYICHLDEEDSRQLRRKLCCDYIWAIVHEPLRNLCNKRKDLLSSVDTFVSANNFSRLLIDSPNPMEIIHDEIEDLMSDAQNPDILTQVLVTASLLYGAATRNTDSADRKEVIETMLSYVIEYDLFYKLIAQYHQRELHNMRQKNLVEEMRYELRDIEASSEDVMAKKKCVNELAEIACKKDIPTINALIVTLTEYNIQNNNLYVEALEKLEKANEALSNPHTVVYGDNVCYKTTQNQIGYVASGGVGMEVLYKGSNRDHGDHGE